MPSNGRTGTWTARTGVHVTGIVQGVGFRPFIYNLAGQHSLSGFVKNGPDGVSIEIEGDSRSISAFIEEMKGASPPLSRITSVRTSELEVTGEDDFRIAPSTQGSGHQMVSADSCTCDQCLGELFDYSDRRFHYPFINCTNCGPRFTIIEELPYDRPSTTMRKFQMCPICQEEYDDPEDRRFHAQPNACPECGPSLWLTDASGDRLSVSDPIAAAADALREGMIVALKGLGGYQLSCMAGDREAVARLRSRKRRPHKPFALMAANLDDISLFCVTSESERELLSSHQRPIVLLERLGSFDEVDEDIAENIAPGLDWLGFMLPYTPLHHLLMSEVGRTLVMTSGNLSEEPICRTNTEALSRLAGIADRFLMHNRGIRSTYDDSVVMIEEEEPVMIRRARGYAPLPVNMPFAGPSTLASGAELKNSFCLTSGEQAFVSQHIGDLENAETLLHLEQTLSLYERLFYTVPERFACDKHPGYLSTAYCLERTPNPLKVQHHQAHIASCLCENGILDDVVGVSFDGTGFGDDGHIWGGEFFTGGLKDGLSRRAHLDYFPLLGGEAAIHEPWRTALALAWHYAPQDVELVADIFELNGQRRRLLLRQLEAGLNCPQTSSCGRLFDAVAALVCGRTNVSYEAQAAMELEAWATQYMKESGYDIDMSSVRELEPMNCRFTLDRSVEPWILSPARAVRQVIASVSGTSTPGRLALAFHHGLADGIVRSSERLADAYDLKSVALSGGVFQNRLLLRLVRNGLENVGLETLVHRQVPPNDGGISLGQAAISIAHEKLISQQ